MQNNYQECMKKRTFKKGDKVFFIDEVGEGLVTGELLDNRYLVLDSDGFENIYSATDLFIPFSKEDNIVKEESSKIDTTVNVRRVEMCFGFIVGDKVRPVDEQGEGLIVCFEGEIIHVEMDYGLTIEYRPSEIVKVADSSDIKMSSIIGDEKHFRKNSDYSKPIKAKKTIRKESGIWEVDLHVHEITEETNNLSSHKLLQIQMHHFESKLTEAINRGVSKVIFIHGRGKGKLRNEIRLVLDRYPNCEYLDGSYQNYGIGATEVIIRKNY